MPEMSSDPRYYSLLTTASRGRLLRGSVTTRNGGNCFRATGLICMHLGINVACSRFHVKFYDQNYNEKINKIV